MNLNWKYHETLLWLIKQYIKWWILGNTGAREEAGWLIKLHVSCKSTKIK